jgi:hypothetical protein
MSELPVAELIARGYRCVSRKYGIVSRIDRPDWIDVVIANTHRTVCSITADIKSGRWQDFYRRVYSKDTLKLGAYRGRQFPNSGFDPVGYVELKAEGEK